MPSPVVLHAKKTKNTATTPNVVPQKQWWVFFFLPLIFFLLSPPLVLPNNATHINLSVPSYADAAEAHLSGGAASVREGVQQAAAAIYQQAWRQQALALATLTTNTQDRTIAPSSLVPTPQVVAMSLHQELPLTPTLTPTLLATLTPTLPAPMTTAPTTPIPPSTPLPTFATQRPTATPLQLPGVGFAESDWSTGNTQTASAQTAYPTEGARTTAAMGGGTPTLQLPRATLPAGATVSIPILMYHYVRDVDQVADPMGYRLSVSPQQFAAQLAWLAQNGYTTMRMAEVAECLQGIRGCPPRAIALTFDDGYDDAYTQALPLLQRYGFVATFYVVAGFVGERGYMGWDELAQLHQAGMEIGSHTLTHPDLTALSRDQAFYEIAHSAELIGGNLPSPMQSFCYPIGKFNPLIESLVQDAGYTNATTTLQNGYQGDLYALPRLRISGEMGQLGFESLVTSYTPTQPIP